MVQFFKVVCLVAYAMAIAGVMGLLPEGWNMIVTIVAIVLAVHALEVLVMFKHVRRYNGPLAMSVLLTLLFGVLHWKPIADGAKNQLS